VRREGELRDWWGCECSLTGDIVYDIGHFSLIGCRVLFGSYWVLANFNLT
jgi:hypothetical protein